METFAKTLDDRLFSTALVLIAAFFSSWIAYKLGFFRISPEEKYDQKIPFKYFMYALLLFFAGPMVANMIGLTEKGWLPVIGVILGAAGLFIYVGFLPAWVRTAVLYNGKIAKHFEEFKNLFFGMATWLVAFPIVAFLGQILSIGLYFLFGVDEADQTPVKILRSGLDHPVLFYFLVISIGIIVPVIEELLFRGFLQSWLKNYGGRVFAVILTSVIFASFHFSFEQGLTNIEFISALFVLSCFLGYIYERQNSLWAPIGLHVMFNLLSISMIVASK